MGTVTGITPAYLRSMRTLTQEQVDELAKAKVSEHYKAREAYEAHAHHTESLFPAYR